MTGGKEVTPQGYIDKLMAHKDEVYQLQLPAWQVPVLHGLIVLTANLPDIKTMSIHSHQIIQEWREWCKNVFSQWGFSPEEVEFLDKMREVTSV